MSFARLRLVVAVAGAVTACLCWSIPAGAAGGRYAAMVVDANTGNTISAHAADEPRYPASLTKMMTLYVVFDLIEQGKLSYATRIRISAEAASTAPSKLGLEAGAEIALVDAVKALITKSANDMAVAIAEHIAGSERKFAALMTQKARQIGMASTTFKNPHGLPDSEQVTTARDMITLGLRLQDDFPKHYPLFSTREFRHSGETHRNHNTLLLHYEGTDGIKTGYTQSSGFNLVANVRRGQKHVLGVVFGGASAAARNQNMRTLLNMALFKASTVKTRQPALIARARNAPAPRPAARPQAVAAATMPPAPRPEPAVRPALDAPPPAAPTRQPNAPATPPSAPASAAAVDPGWRGTVEVARVRPILVAPRQPRQAQLPPPVAEQSSATPALPPSSSAAARPELPLSHSAVQPVALAPSPSAVAPARPALIAAPQAAVPSLVRGTPPSTFQQQAENLARGAAPLPQAAGKGTQLAAAPAAPPTYRLAGPAALAAPVAGGVQIQIGAYNSPIEAEKRIAAVRQQAGDLVGNTPGMTVSALVAGKQMYRARFSGFDPSRAGQVCTELRRRLIDCLVTKAE